MILFKRLSVLRWCYARGDSENDICVCIRSTYVLGYVFWYVSLLYGMQTRAIAYLGVIDTDQPGHRYCLRFRLFPSTISYNHERMQQRWHNNIFSSQPILTLFYIFVISIFVFFFLLLRVFCLLFSSFLFFFFLFCFYLFIFIIIFFFCLPFCWFGFKLTLVRRFGTSSFSTLVVAYPAYVVTNLLFLSFEDLEVEKKKPNRIEDEKKLCRDNKTALVL